MEHVVQIEAQQCAGAVWLDRRDEPFVDFAPHRFGAATKQLGYLCDGD